VKRQKLFSKQVSWIGPALRALKRCAVGEVGVQEHVLVLRRDLEQREQDDQDEDEVNLMNSDF
jgi:hypothetical protein